MWKEEMWKKYAPAKQFDAWCKSMRGRWGRRRGEEGENKLSGVMKWATAEYQGHAYSL